MADCDLLVVGGGISGLTLASLAAADGWRVRVLEAGPRVGGCVNTWHPEETPGFWLELGAHTVFNSYGRLLQRLTAVGLQEAVRQRRKQPYRLFHDGTARAIWRDLSWAPLLSGALRLPLVRRRGRTVADYYTRLFGSANYARVLGPAFAAVVCQPADAFPADLLFRRKPRRRDFPRHFTLAEGLGQLTTALAADSRLDVMLNRRVQRIEYAEGGFAVQAGDTRHFAPRLALAVPAAEVARLLRTSLPRVADPLSALSTARVETLGVVLPRSAVPLPAMAGLIGRDAPFLSMVSRDVLPHPDWRGFSFHFRPGVLDPAAQRTCAAEALRVASAAFTATATSSATLPSPDLAHPGRVAEALAARGKRALALAGNWVDGLSLEECVVQAEKEYARLRRLAPH